MTKNIDSRKIEVLKQITSLDSEQDIEVIERYLEKYNSIRILKEY